MPSSSTTVSIATQMLAGIQKNEASFPQFVILGKPCKASDCISVLQGRVAAEAAVPPAQAAWRAAVKAKNDQNAQTNAFVTALRQQLILSYAATPNALADYGLAPKKTATKTLDIKVVAAAKNRATRTARGTTSKKAKAKIKGNVGSKIEIDVPGAVQSPAQVPSEPAQPSSAPAPIAVVAASQVASK